MAVTGSDEVLINEIKEIECRRGIKLECELERVNNIALFLQNLVESLRSENTNLQSKLELKKQEVQQLQKTILQLQTNEEENRLLIKEKNARIAELQEEIIELKQQISFRDEQIAGLKKKRGAKVNKPPKSQKEKELEKELERLKALRHEVEIKAEKERAEIIKVNKRIKQSAKDGK